MEQKFDIRGVVLAGVVSVSAIALMSLVDARYGPVSAWEDDGCNSGCEPEPEPEDCGCDDGGGHGHGDKTKVKVDIDMDLEVNVDIENNITVDASSNANANAGARAAARGIGQASAVANARAKSGRRRTGGGGGTSIVYAPNIAGPIGNLNVVVEKDVRELKPVQAYCLDAKGLQEAAITKTSGQTIDVGTYQGEVFQCVAGTMMVATIGKMSEGSMADYTRGYQIECQDGEALSVNGTGRLACTAASGPIYTANASSARFAQVILRKGGRSRQSVAAGGGMTHFSGGVGY
ncbi:MAG: hypothetical protein P1U50_11990 [Parvibaculaceae bacterium]|nr:hypothetical protein [Parvibaculaceae bacterium]